MSNINWSLTKNGWVALRNGKGIGVVITPRKGNWYHWIVTDTPRPYSDENAGKTQGRSKAQDALIEAWKGLHP